MSDLITIALGLPLILFGLAGFFVSGGKPSGSAPLDTERGARPYRD